MLLATLPATVVSMHATVPIDNLGGVLVVKATIDGRGPFNLVLDTGAGSTVLTPRVFQALRLSPSGRGTAAGLGTHSVGEQHVVLDDVEVGAAAARDVAAAIIDLPPDLTYQGKYGTIDGILGYTFMKNFAVTVDYAHDSATFARPGTNDSSPLPMTLVHSAPMVHGSVNGVPALLMLDTGNNGISIASAQFAQKAGGLSRPGCAVAEQTHEGVGGMVSTPLVRVRDIRVGNSVIHNVALAISSAREEALAGSSGPDLILGYDFLRRFRVVVDYLHNRLYLTPTAGADVFVPYLSSGMSLQRRADGSLVVQSVSPDSPSAHAGIRARDEILSIDGLPAAELSDADISRVTRRAIVRYRVRSAGRTSEVTLTLHDALPACI